MICSRREANRVLVDVGHYLGPVAKAALAWRDEFGAMIYDNPRSRHLPQAAWLELVRWGLVGTPNGGSRQWGAFRRWARDHLPQITTFVSYSDPSVGHTGALYRACNWHWAPTWCRVRPPPSGNGSWDGKTRQEPNDRWVFALRPDSERERILLGSEPALIRAAIAARAAA